MGEATVAEVTVAVEAIVVVEIMEQPQDHRGVAPIHHQGLTAVHQSAQAPGRPGQVLAGATAAAVPLIHRERVQHGQAVQHELAAPFDKNRPR